MRSPVVLFDNFKRTDSEPSSAGEPLYAFLNRAAGEDWQNVRDALTAWLANYPEVEQPILSSRFKRTDRRGFLGAFWELYLHELFRRLDFDIELHPAIVGTTHRPDFLLRRDTHLAYVEAVTLYEPQAYSTDDARLAPLRQELSRISSSRFHVSVHARQIAATPLPLERLTRELEAWLSTLESEPEALRRRKLESVFRWQEGGWMLIFKPIDYCAAERETRGNDTVETSADQIEELDDSRSIRNRLGGKSRVYGGDFDAPFLIALSSYRPGHSSETALRALFGLARSHPGMMRAGVIGRSRAANANGLWLTNHGIQYQDVSAVLTAFGVVPWSIAELQPELIENPWATHPLKIAMPFKRYHVDPVTGEIELTANAFEPNALFGLERGWPGISGASGSDVG